MAEQLPTLPVNARVLAGQLEDQMNTWRQRRMGEVHPLTRRAGTTALSLTGQIIMEFELFREALLEELRAYDEAARKGMT